MWNNRRLKRVINLIVAVALAIPFAVWVWFNNDIHFEPNLFLTEYYKMLGGIVPVVFGFFLINYYWEQRTEREKTELIKHHLKKDLQAIYDSIEDICDLTAEASLSAPEVNILWNIIIRHRFIIRRAFRDVELLAERITHISDLNLSDVSSKYVRETENSMHSFLSFNPRKASPKGEDFQRVIRDISRLTQQAIKRIEEESDER